MRWNVLQTYNKILILNLHGNSNKKEKCPDGSKDENVFDIQQGVCIVVMIKNSNHSNKECVVSYSDLYGLREEKYKYLQNTTINRVDFTSVISSEPNFYFAPINYSIKKDYDSGFSIGDLYYSHSVGIVTANDSVLIGDTKDELLKKIISAFSSADENLCCPIAYRPFDKKLLYYDRSRIERSRDNITRNFINHNNLGLISARSNKSDDCSHFFISDCMSEAKCGERTTQSAIFPIYLYSSEYGKIKRTPNLNLQEIRKIEQSVDLTFVADNRNNEDTFSPIDILDYIYAILYSHNYRDKYKEFLKMDFPRVPYPTDKEVFWKLVALGSELRECHLMKKVYDTSAYTLSDGSNEVVKPEYKDGKVYISKTQYFDNVPQAQWEQYIGGYQPLQKWLKDRKKTVLTAEEIEHYKKIIAALKRTEEIMAEIDQIVEF